MEVVRVEESHTEIRERFQNIDSEDTRSYLLKAWEDIDSLIRTCGKGKLPSANTAYELIQHLYPAQLRSILRSLKFGLKTPKENDRSENEESDRAFADIEELTSNLLEVFKDIAPNLILLTGVDIPLSMQVDESLSLLLRLKISAEKHTFYSAQILNQALPLGEAYKKVFNLLPTDPDLVFPEVGCESTDYADIEISESDEKAIVKAKAKRAFDIASCIQQIRKKVRV